MTNAGQLSIDFKRLLETSGHINQAIVALRSQLDDLEQAAAPLVQTWSGDARQAYLQRQNTWRQTSADLAGMLQAIKRNLDECMVDYQGMERSNVGLFTR